MVYNYETPFPPKVYGGPPPSEWGINDSRRILVAL